MSEKANELLTVELKHVLAEYGQLVHYQRGDVIFQQSQPGDCMYILEKGEIGLVFDSGKDNKTLRVGEIFGELALLSGRHKRTATAIAGKASVLRKVDQSVFLEMQAKHPSLLIALLRRACLYLIESERSLLNDLLTRNRMLEQTLDYLRRTKKDLTSAELLAHTDELTGLYNRRCFENNIVRYMGLTEKTGATLGLLLIDVDNFKQINDKHGHYIGDLILKRMSKHLRFIIREQDMPFRLGGDEFSVLLPVISETEALKLSRGIITSDSLRTLPLPHQKLEITLSMGGTMRRPEDSWQELYQRADKNLYNAKERGKNQVHWD